VRAEKIYEGSDDKEKTIGVAVKIFLGNKRRVASRRKCQFGWKAEMIEKKSSARLDYRRMMGAVMSPRKKITQNAQRLKQRRRT